MDIVQYILGGLSTILLAISSFLLNGFIKKLDDLDDKLSNLVIDVAVIKNKIENSENRITKLEQDFEKMQSEFTQMKSKLHSFYQPKIRYHEVSE